MGTVPPQAVPKKTSGVCVQLSLDDAFEMQELLDEALTSTVDPVVREHIERAWIHLRLAMRQVAPALTVRP